jgi:restriction endonuclease Mrr
LTELMLKYSIGVKARDTYRTYELDDDTFWMNSV